MAVGRVKSTSGLNLREKPNGPKVSVLAHNEQVEILDEVQFFRIKTSDGRVGYVHGDYLEETPQEDILVSASVHSASHDKTDDKDENFPSPLFERVSYQGSEFIGSVAVVDADFVNSLDQINSYAEQCAVKIWVTSSTRNINEQVNGAIVPPASKSCHHIGHAIDMNVQHNGRLYNSKALRKSNFSKLPDAVLSFLNLVRNNPSLRWGGDFNTQDPVHIDDDLYHRQKNSYLSKLNSRVAQLNA